MSTGLTAKGPVELLLVEDNPGDILLTKEAFQESNDVPHHLNVAMDGEEALTMLRRQRDFGEAVRPDFILLDLNLPNKDGREVLAEIKADPNLRSIPVLILSSSKMDTDIQQCYDLGASCFIRKPVNFDEFISLVQVIKSFWLKSVLYPRP